MIISLLRVSLKKILEASLETLQWRVKVLIKKSKKNIFINFSFILFTFSIENNMMKYIIWCSTKNATINHNLPMSYATELESGMIFCNKMNFSPSNNVKMNSTYSCTRWYLSTTSSTFDVHINVIMCSNINSCTISASI